MDRPYKKVKMDETNDKDYPPYEEGDNDDEEDDNYFRKANGNNDNEMDEGLDNVPPPQKFDLEDLQKLIKNFEKHLLKNQELRSKYPKNPEKFMDSEVDLDEDISKFSILTTETHLWKNLIDSGVVPKFISVLSHENTDLSLEMINFIRDLFDTEIEEESAQTVIDLYQTFIQNKLIEGLVQNLFRLDVEKEDDFEGIHKILNVIENILEIKPDTAQYIVDNTRIFIWLIKRLNPKTPFDDNKLYASEIFSILVQYNQANQFTLGKIQGVEHVLATLADYRKRDPQNEEEREMVENIFDVLCSCLLVPDNQLIFHKNEGVELMIRMIKEKNFCSRLAIKIISYALEKCPPNCKSFIESLGLKFIFPIFMRKGIKEKKPDLQTQLDEQIIAILNSLFVNTSGVLFDRVINKFREGGTEKIDRLIELYEQYLKKYKAFVARSTEEQETQEAIIEKFDILFVLHKIVYILGHIYLVEDEELNKELKHKFDVHGIKSAHLAELLNEYAGEMEETRDNQKEKTALKSLAEKLNK